jgi:predicted MFS family arabinose efflux permease
LGIDFASLNHLGKNAGWNIRPAFFHLDRTKSEFYRYSTIQILLATDKLPAANCQLMITRTISIYKSSFKGLSRPIWFLSLVMLINRSGTMVLPFLTVYLTTRLNFTLEQAGWAMTCFGLGSVAGSFLGGRLTDKIGYYRVQFWSLLLGGGMFLLLGHMEQLWEVYVMIFFLSLIADAFRPASMAAVAAYSRPENRTRSFSLLRLSINLGWSMGPAIGGWLAVFYGYYTLFYADGLTCIAAAFVFRIFLSKKEPVESEKEEEAAAVATPAYRDKRFLFFLFLTILGAVAFMQFLSALPVFYKQQGLSEGEIGSLLAMNGILVVVLEMPLIFILEKKFSKLDCIGWGFLMFGLAWLVLNISGPFILIAVISMISLSIGEIFNMPFTNTYALGRARPSNRGQYMGLFTMAYSIAHIFAPAIGMQVAAHWGFPALWWLMGGLCAAAYLGNRYLQKIEGASANNSPATVIQEQEAGIEAKAGTN